MKTNHHSIKIKTNCSRDCESQNCYTKLHNNVQIKCLDTHFLLLFLNSQQMNLFWMEYQKYIEITNLLSILQKV